MFRTNGELLGLIKTQLESNKTIKLPSLILPTAGRGIVIKESWTIEFEEVDFCYEEKSKIPKSFILHSDNQLIAVLVRRDKNKNEEEIDKLKRKDCNIIEIDLSWAKDGVTEDELKYLTIFCGFLQETLCEFRAEKSVLQRFRTKGKGKKSVDQNDPLKFSTLAEPLSLTTEA